MGTPTRRFHIPSALRRSSLRIDAVDAQGLVERGAVLVDVRRQDDHSAALPGAVRVAPDEVPGRVPEFPREVAIVLACT
ncbi:MAG: rhodanese-like domain-containing protein [Solirubrobacterales bacterium]